MAITPYIPTIKCATTNILVYTWVCEYCQAKNLTLATDIKNIVRGTTDKGTKSKNYATCCKCASTVILTHHTFK